MNSRNELKIYSNETDFNMKNKMKIKQSEWLKSNNDDKDQRFWEDKNNPVFLKKWWKWKEYWLWRMKFFLDSLFFILFSIVVLMVKIMLIEKVKSDKFLFLWKKYVQISFGWNWNEW